MSELFLSVFGVAAAIAFIFYRLGYTQGHRAAHCGNAVHSMAELEKAVRNASESLNQYQQFKKKTDDVVDAYNQIADNYDKAIDTINESLDSVEKYLNELRGDVLEADTFNREMLQMMHSVQLFSKSCLLMNGEQLEQSDFKLSSEDYRELSDKYREYDRQEEKDNIQIASRRARVKRENFMESEEQ